MIGKRWLDRRRLLAHSKRKIAESEAIGRQLDEQAEHVQELGAYARKQVEVNHLTERFLQIIHQGRP